MSRLHNQCMISNTPTIACVDVCGHGRPQEFFKRCKNIWEAKFSRRLQNVCRSEQNDVFCIEFARIY